MLSSYPTKHARIGNAVGLDTPASAVVLLQALREAGYDLGEGFPEDGDTLIHRLIEAGGQDTEWLTEAQLAAAPPAGAGARLRAVVRRAARPACRRQSGSTGASRPAASTPTTATSSWRACGSAT